MTTRELLTIAYKLGFRDGTRDSEARIPRDRDIEHILDALDEGDQPEVSLVPFIEYNTEGDNGRGKVLSSLLMVKVTLGDEFLGNWLVEAAGPETEALAIESKARILRWKLGVN